MKKFVVAVVMLAACLASTAGAGNLTITPYVLFGGSDTDSTEQASVWVPVFGADRVIIRTYTTHLAFGASNADSAFGDSLTTFKLLFSDSVSTHVTGPNGRLVPVCADSFVVDPAGGASTDSTTVGIAARQLPINKPLRAPATGSGLNTIVYPMGLQTNTSATVVSINNIGKMYMRVRVTPLRRLTANTSTCVGSCGKRVNGLRGLKMIAYVVHINK